MAYAVVEWPRVLNLVQMVLNQNPSPTLGMMTPLTAMMASGPSNILKDIIIPTEPLKTMNVDRHSTAKRY